MRIVKNTFAAICTVSGLMFGGSALSQQSAAVTVDIRNVAGNVAQNLSVDASQIPLTVQVPIAVAANVCGMETRVLEAQARDGGSSCTANTTTSALDQMVQQQIKKQ